MPLSEASATLKSDERLIPAKSKDNDEILARE